MIEPTVIRGLRLACGSWKIICISRPQRPERPALEAGDVAALEPDRAAGRLVEPQDRPARRGLAAARLADEPEGLARGDVEARRRRPPCTCADPRRRSRCRAGSASSARDPQQRRRRLRTSRGSPVAGSHQQATSCPAPTGSRGGFSARQRLKTWRQRGANGQDRGAGHQHRRLALDRPQPPLPRPGHARHRAEERAGVGVLRVGEDRRDRARARPPGPRTSPSPGRRCRRRGRGRG